MPARKTSNTLSLRALNRALLARQMLLARETATALQVVERLAGMQAQVARPPFIGIWTRASGFTRQALNDAIAKRTVVRGTAMRGTIHLMSAKDFVALRGAIQPGLTRGILSTLRGRTAALDVDDLVAIGREFFKRTPADFDDFRTHLAKKYPKGDHRAMAYTVRCTLPLVMVPEETPWSFPAAARFALADGWLGKPVPIDDAPAQALVRRYLAAFGPATPADAQAWSGLQGLRAVFEEMRDELVTFTDERKRELFDLPRAPRPDPDTPAPARFVPDFDNLVLAHEDRTRIIADQHRGRIVTKNLLVKGSVLVDGFVAGSWKVERKKQSATVIVEAFSKLPKAAIAALEAESDLLLRFIEEDADTRGLKIA